LPLFYRRILFFRVIFLAMGGRKNKTGLREPQEAVKKSLVSLNNILSAITDLVFTFDEDGRFTFYHTPYTSELYAPPHQFIGEKHSEVMPPHLDELFAEAFEKNRRGEISEYTYQLRIGGKDKYFHAKLSPMFSEDEFTGSVAVVREITELKRKKEDLRAKNRELERINRFLADRELEIIGLKERIKELEEKTGEIKKPP
jgi:PAS domain S-box-containing protein